LNSSLDPANFFSKFLKAGVFNGLRAACHAFHDTDRPNICLTNHTYGLLQLGRTNATYLTNLLPLLPDGLSEIYIHPGMKPEPCSPQIRRDVELAALLSPWVRETLENEKLTATTFRSWIGSEPALQPAAAGEPVAVRG